MTKEVRFHQREIGAFEEYKLMTYRKDETFMELKLIGEKRALLVRVNGELDHHIASSLREAVDSKIRCTNAVNVIFDFSNVGFMDSSGIGVIMGRYKAVKTLGGCVIIFGQNTQIKRIVEMSGIDKIVKIADTYDDALNLI